jgi:hypothetical protein
MGALLPGAVDAERAQSFCLFVFENMLDQPVYAASARTTAEAGTQFGQVGFVAVSNHFHIAVLGVAHPAAQVKFAGLAVHIPAEAHALHAALNEEVKNHTV